MDRNFRFDFCIYIVYLAISNETEHVSEQSLLEHWDTHLYCLKGQINPRNNWKLGDIRSINVININCISCRQFCYKWPQYCWLLTLTKLFCTCKMCVLTNLLWFIKRHNEIYVKQVAEIFFYICFIHGTDSHSAFRDE